MREQIELYRRLGWSIIPLKHRGKEPAIKSWEQYQQQNATENQITSWFNVGHLPNVGIITGAFSGIVVVDIDNRAALQWAREKGLTRQLMPLARTKKGFHLFFKHPGGVVSNRTKLFGVKGFDIRGDGGYVVAAPSIHESGHVYTWETPPDTALPDLPDWLLAEIRNPERKPKEKPAQRRESYTRPNGITTGYGRAALARNLDMVRSASAGNRNDALNEAAFNLGQIIGVGEIDQHTVETELTIAGLAIGLTDKEVEKTIASGIEGGLADSDNFRSRLEASRGKRPRRAAAPSSRAAATNPATLLADQVVDLRYISDLEIPLQGAWLVRSPIGTGKTELADVTVKRLEKQVMENEKRYLKVLYLTHRIPLSRNVSDRLQYDNYQSFTGREFSMISKMVMTVNSLLKFPTDTALPTYDVIIIDEVEQFLSHLGGSTFKGAESVNVHEILRHLISNARLVMAMDAHATEISRDWLKGIRPDTKMAVNSFHLEKKPLALVGSKTMLIAHCDKMISLNEGVVCLATSSIDEAKALYQRYLDRLPESEMRLISSENSMTRDTQDFIQNINRELPKLKLFIYTPSLGTGVDIKCQVRAVYGIFGLNPLVAGDMLQMMGRARKAQSYYATLPNKPLDNPLEIDPLVLFERQKRRALTTGKMIQRHVNADGLADVSVEQGRLLWLLAQIEASRNRSTNDLMTDFLTLANEQYEISMISTSEVKQIKQELKEAREVVKEQEKALALTVDPVDPEAHQDLNGRGLITPEKNAGLQRWHIEDVYQQPITSEIYDHYMAGGGSQLITFCSLAAKKDVVISFDYTQIRENHALHQRRHASARRALIIEAIRAVWGNIAELADTRQAVDLDHINKAMNAYYEKNAKYLELYFNRRKIRSEKPLDILRWLLKKVGLSIEHVRNQIKDNGKYRVSRQSLHLMLSYANTRITSIEKRTIEAGKKPLRDSAVIYILEESENRRTAAAAH